MTSLADLGLIWTMEDADRALREAFDRRFGVTVDDPIIHSPADLHATTGAG